MVKFRFQAKYSDLPIFLSLAIIYLLLFSCKAGKLNNPCDPNSDAFLESLALNWILGNSSPLNNLIYSLDDGLSWNLGTNIPSSNYNGIAYGDGYFVLSDTGNTKAVFNSVKGDLSNFVSSPPLSGTLRDVIFIPDEE